MSGWENDVHHFFPAMTFQYYELYLTRSGICDLLCSTHYPLIPKQRPRERREVYFERISGHGFVCLEGHVGILFAGFSAWKNSSCGLKKINSYPSLNNGNQFLFLLPLSPLPMTNRQNKSSYHKITFFGLLSNIFGNSDWRNAILKVLQKVCHCFFSLGTEPIVSVWNNSSIMLKADKLTTTTDAC